MAERKYTGGATSQLCCYVNCMQGCTCFTSRSRLCCIVTSRDDIILHHFQLNAEHQQGRQFVQFFAKRIKFGIFRRHLDRKFWFAQFLEIWQFICLNIAKCLKSGLQDFLLGYKVFRPYSPTGCKRFVLKRQHCL